MVIILLQISNVILCGSWFEADFKVYEITEGKYKGGLVCYSCGKANEQERTRRIVAHIIYLRSKVKELESILFQDFKITNSQLRNLQKEILDKEEI